MWILESKPIDFFISLVKRYFKDEIGNTSAALAYYLVFSFFPTIVLISTILGYANILPKDVFNVFTGILPNDIIDIVSRYLIYLSENKSTNILMVSLFFTFYFPIRAMSRVMDGINRAYQTESKRGILKKLLLMLIFAVAFILSIAAMFLLLVTGRTVLLFLSQFVGISPQFIDKWTVIRFYLMEAIGFFTLSMIYWLVPECGVKFKEALPGAFFSVFLWLIFSACFSFYVENMGNYSLLFGSIGAIIVLLIWLYMISAVLLMGAEVNSLLKERKMKKSN